MSELVSTDDDLAADLQSAADAYERAGERVAEKGEQRLERLAASHDELRGLFDTYEEEATGDGDFAVFIEFQEAMAGFVDGLPEDLPYRERFEEVDEVMQQRRLTESDFDRAREVLAPIENEVVRLEEREATRERYEKLRKKARRRVRELGERIDDLESLQRLGEADLDAPVERLHEPIETYNDAVADAFGQFRRESSAREVLEFVAATTAFPLVPYRTPPEDLREYVETAEAGTESVAQLLEYADYSTSKLDHYVADASRLKSTIGTNQTYLRRLDADPLQVAWPPRPADELYWRVRELVQVVGRFAPDEVVADLRAVRDLTDDPEYDRLRESAVAREQLTDEQRERLASGAVADDLERARDQKARLESLLADLPEP